MAESTEEHWINGPLGIILAFLWGFAEGTLFFVVPDVLLSLVALFAPRKTWRHILAAIAGAVLAGAVLYTWSAHDAISANRTIAAVPFVTPTMMARVETSYQTRGITAVYLGPLSGIPYKIYAIDAPRYLSEPAFLAATIPARGYRFVLVWLLFGAGGTWLRRFPTLTPRRLVTLHATLWSIFYLFYWGRIALH